MFRQSFKVSWLVYTMTLSLPALLGAGSVRAEEMAGKRTTPASGGQRAEIVMNVPLDAIIFIDGQRITSGGMSRIFVTPPLASGRRYFYDVKVSWVEGSRARESSRHVSFQPGQRVVLNYSQPNEVAARREAGWDLYLDPSAPNPPSNGYYRDSLNYPYYINPSYVFPGSRFYPR